MLTMFLSALKATALSLLGEKLFKRLSVVVIVALLQVVRDGCVWMQNRDVIKAARVDDVVFISIIDVIDELIAQIKEEKQGK